MQHQRRRAADTADDVATVATQNNRGGAAAVEEENCLLLCRQRLVERALERPAEERAIAAAQLRPHVDDADRGQRYVMRSSSSAGCYPLGELQQMVVAVASRLIAFECRRGASQDHHACRKLSQPDRHISRMVAHTFGVLVRAVVLLVHDNQAELR